MGCVLEHIVLREGREGRKGVWIDRDRLLEGCGRRRRALVWVSGEGGICVASLGYCFCERKTAEIKMKGREEMWAFAPELGQTARPPLRGNGSRNHPLPYPSPSHGRG